MENRFKRGDLAKHFKRDLCSADVLEKEPNMYLYDIIDIAEHTESGESLMIYRPRYGERKLYARPLEMFLSPVDREKYPEAKQNYRFEKVSGGKLSRYEYLFFDLDGTLTDPGLGITNAVMYALDKFGISVDDRSELYKFIGPPLLESFPRFYGFTPEQAREATRQYRVYFADKGIFENEIYPGVIEMLKALKSAGKHLVIATSKPQVFAQRIAEHFGFAEYFDFIAGAELNETRTKKWEVIEYAIASCGIDDRSKILMIGDREHDILGAKRCGLDSMGVLYGYGDRAEHAEAGADFIAKSVSDLTRLLTE